MGLEKLLHPLRAALLLAKVLGKFVVFELGVDVFSLILCSGDYQAVHPSIESSPFNGLQVFVSDNLSAGIDFLQHAVFLSLVIRAFSSGAFVLFSTAKF